MSTLTRQARETIRNWGWTERITIAGYTRHYFGNHGWGGDECGCVDDRCIGYHHEARDDCQCLPGWLDDYAKALRSGEATR